MTHSPAEVSFDDLLSHTGWARRLALSLARDAADADDLVQETWLRALRKPPRRGVPVRAWLQRVMRNTAASRWRAEARRETHEAQSVREPDSVEDVLARADLQAEIVQAVQSLSEPQRVVVALHYFEEQATAEIAERLALDVDAVRKRLQRARSVLRDRLAKRCGPDWRAGCFAFGSVIGGAPGIAGALVVTGKQKMIAAGVCAVVLGATWMFGDGVFFESPAPDGGRPVSMHSDLDDNADGSSSPGRVHRDRGAGKTAPDSDPENRQRSPRPSTPTGDAASRDGVERAGDAGLQRAAALAPVFHEPTAGDAVLNRLNGLAKAWFAARQIEDAARVPGQRDRARRETKQAWFAFESTWSQVLGSRDLYTSRSDLLAVFDRAFSYTASGSGVHEAESGRYAFVLPKGYDPNHCYPTAVVLAPERKPRTVARGFKKFANKFGFLVMVPRLDSADLDGFDTPAGARALSQGMDHVLRIAGEFQREYRVDRDRLMIACWRGAGVLGLRLATTFPTRFAGLALASGVHDPSLRYENLNGMPVLLTKSGDSAKDLVDRLEKLAPGSTTVEGRAGSFPFRREDWFTKRRRYLMRDVVVVAPNDDRFRSAYWITLGRCDSIDAGDGAPILTARVDRATNSIEVETRGVYDFRLRLSPGLVDVRDFTLVLNGDPVRHQLEPSLDALIRSIYGGFDTTRTYTAELEVVVPPR